MRKNVKYIFTKEKKIRKKLFIFLDPAMFYVWQNRTLYLLKLSPMNQRKKILTFRTTGYGGITGLYTVLTLPHL
jgi:hypothetical protein